MKRSTCVSCLALPLAVALGAGASEPALVFEYETIDHEGDTGRSPSIAVETDGTPHVAYIDATRHMLRHALRTESGWSREDLEPVWDERGCSLALDAQGRPYVAFIAGGSASCAVWDGSRWRVEFLGGCNGTSTLALTAAPDGSVHACIQGSCSGGIYYGIVSHAIRVGDAWAESVIESRIDNFAFHGIVSIAARDSSDPHIALWNDSSGGVGYVRKTGGQWVREVVGSGGANTIALDASGVPHVVFGDAAVRGLRLGVRGPQGWSVSAVDGSADAGGESFAVAVGTDGGIHIAYYDATDRDVEYARRPAGSAVWSIQTVAAAGDVGSTLDLALDARDEVHIAYYDRIHGDLVYATTRRRVAMETESWGRIRRRFR